MFAGSDQNQGDLSEIKFQLKAWEFGLTVSIPYGYRSKYDFVVDGGGKLSRVQVKSTRRLDDSAKYPSYRLRGTYGNKERQQYDESQIDILACYVVPLDLWYIVPVEELKTKFLRFYPHEPRANGLYEKYLEAWSYLK